MRCNIVYKTKREIKDTTECPHGAQINACGKLQCLSVRINIIIFINLYVWFTVANEYFKVKYIILLCHINLF